MFMLHSVDVSESQLPKYIRKLERRGFTRRHDNISLKSKEYRVTPRFMVCTDTADGLQLVNAQGEKLFSVEYQE